MYSKGVVGVLFGVSGPDWHGRATPTYRVKIRVGHNIHMIEFGFVRMYD